MSSNRTRLCDSDEFPFGNHRGLPLGDVPDHYWVWFLKQDWCDNYPDLVQYGNLVVEDIEE